MTYRKPLQYPNPSLKLSSASVESFDDTLRELVNDMIDTCNVDLGVGLAAPQIGVRKRVVVIKPAAFNSENPEPDAYNEDYLVLVNPSLQISGESVSWKEGCLSVPEVIGDVERKTEVYIKYDNIKGEEQEFKCGWPLSGGLQHECDHLDGVLFIDKMSRFKRNRLLKKAKKRELKRQRRSV